MSKSAFLFFLLFFILLCSTLQSQSNNLDSLKSTLATAQSDSTKCKILYAIIVQEQNEEGDLKFALQLEELSLAVLSTGAISIEKKAVYTSYLIESYNLLGHLYGNRGDAKKGLDYYQKGLKLAESLGDKTGVADFYLNIGYIYSNQGDEARNFEYTKKALTLYQETGNKTGIASALLNVGYCYELKGDLDKGLDYFLQSLEIQQKLGDKTGVAYALANSGRIYQKQGKMDKALSNFVESLKIREELNDKKGIVFSLHKIGALYNEQGKLTDALSYGKKAFDLAKETGYPDLIKRTSLLLYEVCKKQGKFQQALEMHELYIQMKDSIFNKEISEAALQKQLQFDYERKETEIKGEQEKQNLLAREENKKQKIILYSIVIFLLLVAVAAVNTFRSLRLTRKQKRIIEIKSKETEAQKKLVEQKNKDITDSIHYAKRIQSSLLPSEKYLVRVLNRWNKS